jgi:FMN phosphatase YigB (HAD superfamily)
MPRPKGVIFDLGGVLITSPLKAIEEYEAENNIPKGYINYAMFLPHDVSYPRSSAEPNAWAELETGLLRTDEAFYTRWNEDLSSAKAWETFHRARGLQANGPPPRTDAEKLLRRMIIPKEGGKLIPETFTALRRLKENGVITCGLTNNFVFSSGKTADKDY